MFFTLDSFSEDEKTLMQLRKGRQVDDVLNSKPSIVAIISGLVGVYEEDGKTLISQLKGGDVFGVSNLFNEEELTTKLFVLKEAELVFIEKEVFIKKLMEDRKLFTSYNIYLNGKINFLLSRVSLLSLKTAKERVKAYYEAPYIQFETKDEVASYLAISRAQLYRELSLLKKPMEEKK